MAVPPCGEQPGIQLVEQRHRESATVETFKETGLDQGVVTGLRRSQGGPSADAGNLVLGHVREG
jgi:hypothetical protein